MATTLSAPATIVASGPKSHRGLWSDAGRRLAKNRFALISAVVLVAILFVVTIGTRIGPTARYGPNDQNYEEGANHQGPSWEHWFGTDQLGRDIFSRIQEGTRTSLEIGFGTAAIVLTLGLAMGSLAAFGAKWIDNVVMRFTDIMFAFPDILLILLIRAIFLDRDVPILTNDKVLIIFAISMTTWTTIARLVRGQMLSLQERDFVLAARALGAKRSSVIIQHMLPNTLGPVIVAVTFAIPAAIFAEAALSFIGLGIPPPDVSLGELVNTGRVVIQRNVWAVIFPGATIGVLMLSFTFLGDGLRDALDPRSR
jgi:oligopeptide transport system permease protein